MSIDVIDLRSLLRQPARARRAPPRRPRHRPASGARLTGLRVLGLGYATPYLAAVSAPSAERTLAFMPASQGVVNWPATGALRLGPRRPADDAAARRLDRPGAAGACARNRREPDRAAATRCGASSRPAGASSSWRRTGGACGPAWTRRPSARASPSAARSSTSLMRETLFSPGGLGRDALRAAASGAASCCARRSPGSGSAISFSLPFAGLHVVEATKQLYRPVTVRQPRRVARLARAPAPAPARGSRHAGLGR